MFHSSIRLTLVQSTILMASGNHVKIVERSLLQIPEQYFTIAWTLVKNIALLTSVQVIVCLKKVQLGLKHSMKNWSICNVTQRRRKDVLIGGHSLKLYRVVSNLYNNS